MSISKRHCLLFSLLLSFFILSVCGCASTPDSTASGFLQNYSQLEKGVYFKREYIDPNASFADVGTVKVVPINLSYLDDKTSCTTTELEKLANEFRDNIEKELEAAGFTVTSHPGGDTLLVRIALTNIEPPQVLQNVAVSAASFMSPVPLPFDNDGVTAFEGSITRGNSNKPLIEFSEMDAGAGGFNLKSKLIGGYTKFTNSEILFRNWAHDIAKMLKDLKEGKKAAPKSGVTKALDSAASMI
jgi:hypothetical protein